MVLTLTSRAVFAGPQQQLVQSSEEDLAEHVCIAAAIAFLATAPASHGRHALLVSSAYKDIYLRKFADEWHATPSPQLKTLLLESYGVATERYHLWSGRVHGTPPAATFKADFADAERELGVHCMYAMGRLDGQGKLLEVLGR